MAMHFEAPPTRPGAGDYLFGPGEAWFAFAMTIALMMADYIDRQVIVSLFPHIKQEWSLSDKQLGSLVSVVSLTVAAGSLRRVMKSRSQPGSGSPATSMVSTRLRRS